MPTPTPLPIAIQGTVVTANHDIVNWLLFISTAVLATFTYRLFVSTRNIASDTLAAARLADRHHQESLRPVIKILSARVTYQEWIREGRSERERGSTIGASKVDLTPGQSAFGRLRFFVRVRNIGTGSAINIQATFVVDGFEAGVFPIESRRPSLRLAVYWGPFHMHVSILPWGQHPISMGFASMCPTTRKRQSSSPAWLKPTNVPKG